MSSPKPIAAEPERIAAGWGWDWHYVQVGLYARQLRRYFDLFAREQIAVFLYDDFQRDPLGVYRAACRHIGVDEGFVPDMSERSKAGSRPKNAGSPAGSGGRAEQRSRLIRHARPVAAPLIGRLKDWNAAPIPKWTRPARRALIPRFRDDLDELAPLLDRDIPWYRYRTAAAA